ncbi:MAG TPA: bifunctional DNA-formamidopyrimidine glycosylase/DNA-(apurinic or apyrimidinic site) lyase [Alphaproteobacteria bacterium]|nr:bifunctional DNA-formamidopyrimidine glycosylase/DNA-(apurinic or apyrimidinic site) lyase [Alphaproteobacteria bacterium]USO05473.1 MAG: bifunctional DNA-formamidopyrimidine glycosylase/DNA-(apurinic or apyrimidinic site) lyase [Rhodospirillales bacterium]HOO81615.1 bifunctional DNA-formamidopyrimidine glycosylase/DNA-(apurinic or apyrimidinic site) lyase [Alphaproteobacteria bacterium]
MPELPEVEIVKRALEPAMVGRRVKRLVFNRADLRFPLPQGLPAALQGQRIECLLRRGKYILGFAENGAGFVLHLGMSGAVRIEPPGSISLHEKHDHVEFYMDEGLRVVLNDPRRFGFLDAVGREDCQDYPALAAMGPEPLGNDFNAEILAVTIKGRKTPIKSALLDQRIVAGLGNIYVCEALYRAAIDPRRKAGDLNAKECTALCMSIRSVLRDAIEAGGSSLKDYKHTDGQLGYFQHHFAVYDRVGQGCGACECDIVETGGVQRIVQAGRSTFFCPEKQG